MNERFSFEAMERPTPRDLPAFLPHACAQLLAPFELSVLVEQQEEYVSKTADDKLKKGKSAKSTIQPPNTSRTFESPQQRDEALSAAAPPDHDADLVALTAVLDPAGHLVELALRRPPAVPRLLLKVLQLCAPFHPALHRLTVRFVSIAGDALHEMARLLALSNITEVCLDDSPVPACNYYLLLDEGPRLRTLSLARCLLDDRDCALLAARLHHPLPAARTLHALGLAANRIGDAGAAALADALRTNRALQYLNLAGNRISDEGAGRLLDALAEFPLTHEELVAKRRRLLHYLRLRDELARKCYHELVAAERAQDEHARGAKRRQTAAPRGRRASLDRRATSVAGSGGADQLAAKSQLMACELVGAHSDPFGPEDTVSRDGHVYSLGNSALCALNLAYNELGYASVAKLVAVLQYQARRAANAAGSAGGLLRVVVEGNALPAACGGLRAAGALLERALWARPVRPQGKKSERDRVSAKAKSK